LPFYVVNFFWWVCEWTVHGGCFKLMPHRDSAAYNLVIGGYVEEGDMDSARSLFDGMPVGNVI
jgi:pentatricopeptide repeat protein